jgi:acyl carrier protein
MTTISRAELDTVLVEHVGLDPDDLAAPGESTLVDLGVDSIGVIELEKVLSDRYGIELPEESQSLSVARILEILNEAGETQRSVRT